MTFEEILSLHGKLAYRTYGKSMLPWIHEKTDIAVIEKVSDRLRKYDTVLFIRPHIHGRGRYVLHRIVKCYKDGSYCIMGDNTVCGERVLRRNIIGVLTVIQQPGKTIRVNHPIFRCKVRLWWMLCVPLRIFLGKGKERLASVLRGKNGV